MFTSSNGPFLYRVLAAPDAATGGKHIAVFESADTAKGNLQAQAQDAGAGVSVFIDKVVPEGVFLEVYSPAGRKGESDSGALAALRHLQERGDVADLASVWMDGQEFAAQLCGGEWLLKQGQAQASVLALDPAQATAVVGLRAADVRPNTPLVRSATLNADGSLGRANLLLAVTDHAALDRAQPQPEAIAGLNRDTDTLGLIVYTVPGRLREDTDFRYFAPLKNITEDNASSNTFATLVAGLSVLGLLSAKEPVFRASQGYAQGKPSRLTAQATLYAGGANDLWVGGQAQKVNG